MTEEIRHRDYELHTDEVQEVMGRIPSSVQRYGIGIILGILMILGLLSLLIPYPQTVEADFTLMTQPAPVYIKTQEGGRIERINAENNQPVKEGDMLGVLENVARTDDVMLLRERMREWHSIGSRIEQLGTIFFQRIPELGSVQASYATCLTAWTSYLQHMNESRNAETEVMNAVAGLANALEAWEALYLWESPADGKVAFLQPLVVGQLLSAGETVMVVVPDGKVTVKGKAAVPMDGIGKVAKGQRVIVRLPAFPEQEYGFLEGKVSAISPVPNADNVYIIEVDFPKGLRTSYGKELPLVHTMNGSASIVTKDMNVLKRLLMK